MIDFVFVIGAVLGYTIIRPIVERKIEELEKRIDERKKKKEDCTATTSTHENAYVDLQQMPYTYIPNSVLSKEELKKIIKESHCGSCVVKSDILKTQNGYIHRLTLLDRNNEYDFEKGNDTPWIMTAYRLKEPGFVTVSGRLDKYCADYEPKLKPMRSCCHDDMPKCKDCCHYDSCLLNLCEAVIRETQIS